MDQPIGLRLVVVLIFVLYVKYCCCQHVTCLDENADDALATNASNLTSDSDSAVDAIPLSNVTLQQCPNVTTLHVGLLVELSGHWFARFASFFPIVFEHTFAEVQAHAGILDGFKFKMTVKDTKTKGGYAAAQLIKLLEEGEPKVAVFGPTFSGAITVTGQIVPVYNIIELSYYAITAATVDRSRFPTLFKVNQDTDLFNPLRIKMMQQFSWSRVGTIVYQDDLSAAQMSTFHGLLIKHNMTLVSSASFTSTSSLAGIVSSFKQFDIRIIMVAIHMTHIRQLFCQAYKHGLYGDSYVWVLSGTTIAPGWVKYDRKGFECKGKQVNAAAEGHFTLHNLNIGPADKPTISGKTPPEQLAIVRKLLVNTSYIWANNMPWIIDSVWAFAIGLNNSLLCLQAKNLSLHEYSYSEEFLECILAGMYDVTFDGVSGPVSFDSTGSRIGLTYIKQNFYDRIVNLAYYHYKKDELTWKVPKESIWTDGRIPQDQFVYSEYVVGTSWVAVAVIVVLNCVGCFLSLAFIGFNIYYRNNRSIKMSSPMLNHVIIGGCMLMYFEVFTTVAHQFHMYSSTPGDIMCMARTWLVALGFTMLFGTLFAKTYRVYVLFRSYTGKPKIIKGYHLLAMVGIMLLIDLIILVPWTVVSPLLTSRKVTLTKDTNDSNIIFSEVYLYCHHDMETYWIIPMYVYKGFLLAFGVFLAWETRNVTVPELNDSKYIGACIYNVVVICVFGVPLVHVMPIEQNTLVFVLESCLIFFCTTICQCILFLPKVQNRNKVLGRMLQEKSNNNTSSCATIAGTKLFEKRTLSDSVTSDKRAGPEEVGHENSAKLRTEIEQLHNQITKEAIAVTKLKRSILRETGDVHFYKSGEEYVVIRRRICQKHGIQTDRLEPKIAHSKGVLGTVFGF